MKRRTSNITTSSRSSTTMTGKRLSMKEKVNDSVYTESLEAIGFASIWFSINFSLYSPKFPPSRRFH